VYCRNASTTEHYELSNRINRNIYQQSEPDLPVVFWCLDNSCFRALTASGDLVAIAKQKDKKFHVLGDLAVAPYTILNNILRELKRAIVACGNRLVLVMEVLPRFLLRPCCEDTGHCINTRLLDAAGNAAGKRILHDLADLNLKIADYTCPRATSGISQQEICWLARTMQPWGS
jgi:hypothetical protein